MEKTKLKERDLSWWFEQHSLAGLDDKLITVY